jgi:hypothetical protein
MILSRHLLGGRGYQAPSATLNIAIVGAGGMGMSNMSRLFSENIVAICDVDFPYVERSLEGRLRPRQGPQVDAREAERMAESRKLQEIYTAAEGDERRRSERLSQPGVSGGMDSVSPR